MFSLESIGPHLRILIVISIVLSPAAALTGCDARQVHEEPSAGTVAQPPDQPSRTSNQQPERADLNRDEQKDRPAAQELYKVERGRHEISVRAFELPRADQGEPLQVRVTWPVREEDDANSPVLIFSHGGLGSRDNHNPVIEHWASHGYICIQPTHGDSASLMSDAERRQFRSVEQALNSPRILRHWRTRPDDVKLILDSFDLIEAKVPELAGQIDRERVAHGGHSFGANTAMLMGGVTANTFAGRRLSFADNRIRAIIAISPQGSGRQFDVASYRTLRVPALMITGSKDVVFDEQQGYAWRREAFDLAPKEQAYLLSIDGAHHGFGGIAGTDFPSAGPEIPHHVDHVRSAVLAFLDAHVLDDELAKAYLKSGTIEHLSEGAIRLERE